MEAYIQLLRPINCLMMGFAVIVGYVIASRGIFLIPPHVLVFGFLTAFLLTASSMVLNDYFDREIDAINNPFKPIPSGKVSPASAVYFAAFLTVCGILAAALINLLCLTIAILSFAVSTAYNGYFKRTGFLGNLMVSLCVAIPFIFGSAMLGEIYLHTLIFFAMVFLANTGREITKGIVDIVGDRSKGVLTLAVRYGESFAAKVAILFYVAAVMLSPLPWLLGYLSIHYLLLVLIADIGFTYSSIVLLRSPSKEVALKVKKEVLLWMFIGLVAFLVGSLF